MFHHSTVGDPITLAEPDGRNEREIVKARVGEHQHYVMFAPDKRYIYFVKLWRSTEADVWRVPTAGGAPEQLTHHNSHVAYPGTARQPDAALPRDLTRRRLGDLRHGRGTQSPPSVDVRCGG